MALLLYIHGFLSSPSSAKAVQTERWLSENLPDMRYLAPRLTPYPKDTAKTLERIVEENLKLGPVYLLGSSMGGFWSTYLAERYDLPAVLINPACEPDRLMPLYLNQELRNYHTDDSYRLEEHHVTELDDYSTADLVHKENFWVMVQTGDETLDYRKAVQKYRGCKVTIEPGGDHSFQGFDTHLPAITQFFTTHKSVLTAN
jgi:predicted esterase YcpF (UPF0227 family)